MIKSTLYANTTEREINLEGNFVIIYAGISNQTRLKVINEGASKIYLGWISF